jgi:hypothetical protein
VAGLIDFLFRRHAFELLLDLMLVAVAYYTANRLRFEAERWPLFFPGFLRTLPLVIACHILGLLAAGAYGRMWRYFSVTDLVPLAKGVVLGSLTSVLLVFYLYQFNDVSRAALFTHAVLLIVLLAGSWLGSACCRRWPAALAAFRSAPGAGAMPATCWCGNRRNARMATASSGSWMTTDEARAPRSWRADHRAGVGACPDPDRADRGRRILSSERFTPGAIEEVRACARAGVPVMQPVRWSLWPSRPRPADRDRRAERT